MNYDKLTEVAERLDVIRAFHSDLWLHDNKWLRDNPSTPFLWGIGDCGTHIMPLDKDYFTSWKKAVAWYEALVECYGHYAWFVCRDNPKQTDIRSNSLSDYMH